MLIKPNGTVMNAPITGKTIKKAARKGLISLYTWEIIITAIQLQNVSL